MSPLRVRHTYAVVETWIIPTVPENNLALQDDLYKLRSDTQEAFDRAKQLEARWKEIEKEQREVYQVSISSPSI